VLEREVEALALIFEPPNKVSDSISIPISNPIVEVTE
jgi:hypothetical protein